MALRARTITIFDPHNTPLPGNAVAVHQQSGAPRPRTPRHLLRAGIAEPIETVESVEPIEVQIVEHVPDPPSDELRPDVVVLIPELRWPVIQRAPGSIYHREPEAPEPSMRPRDQRELLLIMSRLIEASPMPRRRILQHLLPSQRPGTRWGGLYNLRANMALQPSYTRLPIVSLPGYSPMRPSYGRRYSMGGMFMMSAGGFGGGPAMGPV